MKFYYSIDFILHFRNGNVNNHFLPIPQKLFRELEKDTLILSEAEVLQEEVPILCRFMQQHSVAENLKCLMIVKCTANTARGGGKKHTKDTGVYVLSKLIKVAIDLISKCSLLEMVIFDNIIFESTMMDPLGQALFVSTSSMSYFM